MTWILESLIDAAGPLSATTQLSRFQPKEASLFIWEAFVSGTLKATTHAGYDELAVAAFLYGWPNPQTAITPELSVFGCRSGSRRRSPYYGR
jgi:hypothetical protein